MEKSFSKRKKEYEIIQQNQNSSRVNQIESDSSDEDQFFTKLNISENSLSFDLEKKKEGRLLSFLRKCTSYTKKLTLFYKKSPEKLRSFTFNTSLSNIRTCFPPNLIRNQKYNLLSFVPLVLFHQFKFFLNLYFLLIAITQFFPVLQIGYIYTYWGPLIFVLCITMSKEAYDDYQRYKNDFQINMLNYERLTPSGFIPIKSYELNVGDVILIKENQRVPADCVLLKTTEITGSCFIRTDQLDGETDWKLRSAISSLQKSKNNHNLITLPGIINTEQPKKDVSSLYGSFLCNDTVESISVVNSLWASTVLASGEALACVIYTGKETRNIMNINKPKSKIGLFDKEIDILAKFLIVLTLFLSFLLLVFKGFTSMWYIHFFRFLILLSYIIPISMRVNLDFARIFHSFMITSDSRLPNVSVKTSNIPEELARIHYLLTDKTGTLTKNEMVFRQLHIGTMLFRNDAFSEISDVLSSTYQQKRLSPSPKTSSSLLTTFRSSVIHSCINNVMNAIALCHNVTPVYKNDVLVDYQGASPDEVSLVKWSAEYGLSLIHRDACSIILKPKENNLITISYQILHIFPFTSEKKRMGIVVKNKENGLIKFYLKGADVVMKDIVGVNDWLEEECENMAREGLRTLVFAEKLINSEFLEQFEKKLYRSNLKGINQQKHIEKVMKTLECNMDLLGLTGVEDTLQDDVKSTLEYIRNAGIKIWMLTGDKIETAICVAISSRLISRTQGIFKFEAGLSLLQSKVVETKVELNDTYRELCRFKAKVDSVLIIDGFSLSNCIQHYEKEFFECARVAPAVLCCRCSPTQKAEIVRLIRKHSKQRICAVGDGGNDVSMIQDADVGIGLVGKEGKQASLASDVSITQFNHIMHLLFWHGRNSYKRSASLTQFLIHRGLLISVIQLIFSSIFYFSAISLYQGQLMIGYVTLYTSLPVFSLVFDEDLNKNVVMLYPELYKELTKGRILTLKTFFSWLLISIYQGSIIMIGALMLFYYGEFIHIVSVTFTSLILTEFLMIGFAACKFHLLMLLSILLSVLVYITSIFFMQEYFGYNYLCLLGINPFLDSRFLFSLDFVWKTLLITLICCFPLFLIKKINNKLNPPSYLKL